MIKVGDHLPEGFFRVKQDDGSVKQVTTHELFDKQKVVLVGVPGAFTSTCHNAHIPTFVRDVAAIKGKGVNRVAVMAVNDHHVMQAWHDALKADGIDFLADGSGVYARAMGLETDLSENGLGVRVKRFVMIAEDGVVEYLALEPPGGKITVTGAEDVLTHL